MSAIDKATNKETKKAEAVLKSVINDLTKEGLNEERVQTDHTFQLLATASDFRNSPLVVGEEWSTATLDWRRYVYEQVPTAATHAQDKSVRSSSRRFDSQSWATISISFKARESEQYYGQPWLKSWATISRKARERATVFWSVLTQSL